MMDAKFLVILALAASATAGPISITESDKCSATCKESNKFQYTAGNTYTYDYRVDTETAIGGASEDKALMTIQTVADIEVLSPCEFALRLRDTRLMHSQSSGQMKAAEREGQFSKAVEDSELRFSFQDGVVDTVCCGATSEDAWVLNFKKGVLSSFQNSMDDVSKSQNLTETDITGECRTEYKVTSDGYYTASVTKSKDMNSCTQRHQYKTMLQMTPYNVPSELQSIPIMKTSHECVQGIQKAGVLKSSVCTETHVFRPFANGNSGGVTTVKQALTYKTYSSGVKTRPAAIMNKDTLVFDHSENSRDPKMARVDVEQRLRDICDTSSYDVRPRSPRQFSELATAMRSLSQADLEDLHRLLKTKTMCSDNDKTFKFYLDALPLVSTDASVKVMSSLIVNGDVKGVLAKAWIASLGFVQTPTSEMLVAAKALVDSDSTQEDALLLVSSMVNNYCRKMTSCDQDFAVLSIMASLERNIGYSCDATGDNFEKVLLSLRAIGNAGHASRAVGPINTCLRTDTNPLEIRVAAAEAFRRMPCDAKNDELWTTYNNGDLDSELRVAAYLALMRCPNDATLGEMAASLVREEDDQVGAFVYSHLKNLRQTSDPHRQETARAAQNLALDKEFELSATRFSRNYEMSALINKLNMGFGAESNLVWSSKSQMPRSISGNLTVDMFGQAVNLMDFGARLEGMEYLVKNLLGDYLNGDKDAETLKDLTADDVEGSVYGRVFGNEMFFMHTRTMASPFKRMPSSWLDLLIQLSKKQDYALTQSAQFMDVSLIIPTSSGLPLTVDVNGTATLDLVLNGKMDLRKLGSSPRSLDIDGEIRPSAALEISGSMSMDAMVTKTGLRMRNTLHTSTAMKGRVQLQRGQLLNVELDTPQDKMEIFNAQSNFFILHNDMEQKQEMIKKNRQDFKVCTGKKMATIAGVQLCGELSFPNASMESDSPYFPMTGPSSASVTLYKKDSHNGYKIFAKRVENKKASQAQISLNTPGSKVDRAILADVSLNYNKQTLDATMRTPWKKAAIKGMTINTDKMKSVQGSLVIDDVDTYSFTSEMKVDKQKNKIQLSPMIEVIRPGADNVQLTGYVSVMTPFKSADIDLSLSGINKMPYTLKTAISNTKKIRSINAAFSPDGKQKYTLEASNALTIMGKKAVIANLNTVLKVNSPTKQIVSMEGSAEYKEDKTLKLDGTLSIYRLLKKPANLKVSLVKNAKARGSRYDIDVNIKSSGITGKLDTNVFIKNSGLVSTKSILGYTIPKVAKNKITLGAKFNDRSTKSYKKYTLRSNLDIAKNKDYNMGLNVDIDHKLKHSAAEVELKYGPNPKDKTKRLFFATQMNRKVATLKNAILSLKINALAPEHNVNVNILGKHQHTPKMVDSNINLNYGGKGKDVRAEVTLRDKSSKLSKVNGKAALSWPGSSYTLSSSVDQKSAKQYAHVLNLKDNSGKKHTVTTMYKNAKPKSHGFTTKFQIAGMKPVTLSGSTTMDPRNFELSGEMMKGKAAYGFKSNTKVAKSPSAKVALEVYYPDRRMTMTVDGGKMKGKYNGRVEAAWDADKDDSQVLIVDGSGYMKNSKKAMSLSGDLSVKSPFQGYEDLMTTFKYGSDESQHEVSSKTSWGGKDKQMTSNIVLKRPFSMANLQMSAEANTPFNGFKIISFDVDHSLEPTLKTILAGRLGKDNGKLMIEGDGDLASRNVKGSVALKSTLKGAKDIKFNFAHNDEAGKVDSSALLSLNGKPYGYDINMAHAQDGWTIKNKGDLVLTHPSTKVKSTWSHKSNDKDIKSSFSSDWGKQKRIVVNIDGSHDLLESGVMKGDINIQTPWKSMQSMDLAVSHKHGEGMISSKASMKKNGKVTSSGSLKYNGRPNEIDLAFDVASPLKDVSGKINTNYASYPMTGLVLINWDPKAKAVLEGSLNLPSWDDANAELKLTTPIKGYRNIVFTASNKKENGETVSNMNLANGVRQSIDLENRVAFNDMTKMLRMKLKTPFEYMKSLNTGFTATGEATNFDGSVDFQMVPLVGKFEGSANWQYDDELKGKLRLDTPFNDFPYLELATTSLNKGQSRQSIVTAEYSPRQNYKLETLYTFDFPISVEATINTPFPEYDNLGVAFQHSQSPSSVMTHGEVTFQPNRKIEGDVNMDWAKDIEGTFTIKTPFEGFETSNVLLRHKGDMDSFISHGEVNVAEKSVSADADFKSGYNTNGAFTFQSPIPGLENVQLTFNKRGNMKNIKGNAAFILNGERSQATINNKLNDNTLKSAIGFSTPYTENFKLSVDHNGALDSFTNKMSVNYGRDYDVDTIFAFNLRPEDISGNGMIKAKLGGKRQVGRINFSKTGNMEDMAFSGTTSYNRDAVSVDGSWKLLSGIEGNLQFKTPFENFRNFGVTLTHQGDVYNFKTESTAHIEDDHVNGKVELASGLNKLQLNTEFLTPFDALNNFGLTLSHDGDVYNFKTESNAHLNSENINGKVELSSGLNRLRFDTEMLTPFDGLKNFGVSVSHDGDLYNFKSESSGHIENERANGKVELTSNGLNRIQFSTELSTPFDDFKNFGISLTHDGDMYNFKTASHMNLDDKNIDGKVEMASNGLRRVRFSTDLSTPFEAMRSTQVNVEHDFDEYTMALSGSADLSTTIGNFGQGSVTYSKTGDLDNFTAQLNGKYAGDEAEVSVSKRGSLEDLTVSTSAKYNQQSISVDGSLKTFNGLQGTVELKTPFDDYKNVEFKLSHHGEMNDFNSQASLDFGGRNNYNGQIEFSADGMRLIKLSSELNTPRNVLGSNKLTLNHRHYGQRLTSRANLNSAYGDASYKVSKTGSLNDFSLDGKATLNGEEMFNGKLNHQYNEQSLSSNADISTPLGSAGYQVSKTGSLNDLSIDGKATYNGDEMINGKLNHQYNEQRLSSNADVSTAFGSAGYQVSKTGSLNDMTLNGKATYNGEEMFNGKLNHQYNEQSLSSNADVSTPLGSAGYQVSKSGSLNDLSIDGKATYNGVEMVNGKLNHQYDEQKLSSKADITSAFGGAGYQISKSGSLNDLNMEGKATYNGEEMINGKLSHVFSPRSMNTIVNLKSVQTPDFELSIEHNGDLMNFNCKAQGILGSDNMMSLEASVNNRGDVIDGEGKMMYRTMDFGSNQGSIKVHKEGQLDDFSVTVSGDLNKNKASVTCALKVKDEITGSLNVNTPVEGYESFGLSFKHSGDDERFNTEAAATCSSGNNYSAKIDFYRYLLARIQANLEVRTPIQGYEFNKYEYRHEQEDNSFKCYSTLEYGNSQKITYAMTADMSPNPTMSVEVKTPFTNWEETMASATMTMTPNPSMTVTVKTSFDKYEDMMASASMVNNWPVASVNAKINAGNGNIMSLDGTLDVNSGVLTISTPFEDFTNVGMSFKYGGEIMNFNSEVKITYMDNKDISGKVTFKKIGGRTEIFAELKTPFNGYKLTRYSFKEISTKKQYVSDSKFTYGYNKKQNTYIKVVYAPNPEMLITIETPTEGYEKMSASYSVDITGPKYKLDSNVDMGTGRSVSLNGALDTSDDISGSINLKTPIDGYKNLGMEFHHSGSAEKFSCDGKMNYADGQDISGKVNFYTYQYKHLTASAELNTPFTGLENTKADVKIEMRKRRMSASSSLQYGSAQEIEGTMKMTFAPNYDIDVTIKTPFEQLRNVRAEATADLNAPSYQVSTSLVHNNNKPYKVIGKLNLESVQKLDGSLVLRSPIAGLEYTKAEYQHKVDSTSVDGSVSLNAYSAELMSTYYPSLDASLKIKTPMDGYNTIEGSVSYEKSFQKYETSSSLKLEGRNLYTMSSGLDYSIEPMKVSTKISTPYANFRDMELVLTHEGQLYNFKSTGFLASPLTDNVNAQVAFDYENPFDMSVSTSVKSVLPEMDDLNFKLQTSDLNGEKKVNAVAGWTDGQQIETTMAVRSQESWYESTMSADMSLSTPFIALRSLSVQTEGTKKTEGQDGKLSFEVNGAKLLDVSADYNTKDKHVATLTFVQPWPMQYTASGSSQEGSLDADLYANWNRDTMDSNVRLVAALTDTSDSKSIDASIESSTRKVGVTHSMKSSDKKLTSAGKLYWDSSDEDQVSYDFSLTENSRRNKAISDASLKLALPSRTLELAGSMSDSPSAKAADASFSWDVSRDSNKKVGVKATMTRGDSLRGDVTLSMPSLNKEIRVDGELMLDNGRVILDSKTDISYSKDSRKTVTLISKVKDISDYYSRYNYSMELGLSHPYTNIDLQLSSHVGSSDEKMTAGVETSYLTASRLTKNLALLAEINKMKKQISVQMFNPTSKFEIVGDVISENPSKMRLLNRINDQEVFRSDLTLDSDKQFAEISALMGDDTYSLTAEYPNSKEFRAYTKHSTPEYSHQDSLLAVRLNTSRLLHSRLAWRPAIFDDLTAGLSQKSAMAGVRAATLWALANQAIADEVSGKYTDVSSHLKEELESVVDILEREMNSIAYKLAAMQRDVQGMYQRNDYFLADVASSYQAIQMQLNSVNQEYRRSYTEMIQNLRNALSEMASYPMREKYIAYSEATLISMATRLGSSIAYLDELTGLLKQKLEAYKDNVNNMDMTLMNKLYNGTYVNYAMDKLSKVTDFDISPYVQSFQMPEVPEELSNVVDVAKDTAMSGINSLWQRPDVDMVRGKLNSVYQQSAWAYKYWDVEKNMKENIDHIITLLREIVEMELKEFSESCRALNKNPITVWDPEHGEIQAELSLPIDVNSLQEVPDFSPLVKKANKVANQVAVYLPDQTTWKRINEAVSEYWPTQEETTDNPILELQKLKVAKIPKKRLLKAKKNKKYNKKNKMRKYKQ